MPPGDAVGLNGLTCVAWTHATPLQASGDPHSYDPAPRIAPPADHTAWPAPQHRPHAVWPDDGWLARVLDGGTPRLPDGVGAGRRRLVRVRVELWAASHAMAAP